ncbi:MAG TPA: hypothetical protein EYM70_03150 [Pelagibacteraceae bacterium]|nr:hypothetical protein [Pelagibacteraceae bacterium]
MNDLAVAKLVGINSNQYKLVPFNLNDNIVPSIFEKETLNDDYSEEKKEELQIKQSKRKPKKKGQMVKKEEPNNVKINMLKEFKLARQYFGSINMEKYNLFFKSLACDSLLNISFEFDKNNRSFYIQKGNLIIRFIKAKKLLQFLFSNKKHLSKVDQLSEFLNRCKTFPRKTIKILSPNIQKLIYKYNKVSFQ